MIGYITLGTNDLPRAAAFYDLIAAEFGVGRMMDFDTFVLALSDIANQLYSQYYHNGINELQTRGES